MLQVLGETVNSARKLLDSKFRVNIETYETRKLASSAESKKTAGGSNRVNKSASEDLELAFRYLGSFEATNIAEVASSQLDSNVRFVCLRVFCWCLQVCLCIINALGLF